MQGCRKCICVVVIKSEQRGESDTAHATAKRAFLRIKPVWPYTLVSHQMKRLIFVWVVSLLKDSDVVGTAFVKIVIFVGIDWVDLQTDIPEIFPRQLARFADVFHVTYGAALAGQHQDFLNAGVCNDFHLMLDFLKSQFLTMNVVVAVKSAVHTVILAVVCNVKRCEQIHRISEMLACLDLCTLCHALQKRLCGWRKQCFKILNATVFML